MMNVTRRSLEEDMLKEYCDICKREVTDKENATRYKLKREWFLWHERGWERLIIHDKCWLELGRIIRENVEL